MNHYIVILIIWVIGSLNNVEAQSCANNSLAPLPELHIEDGDIFIEGSCDGIVMTAPNGTCFRVLVQDDGSFGTEAVACPFTPCMTCPEDADAPSFLQEFSNLSFDANGNCEAEINVSFQIEYCIPDHISMSFSIAGPNSTSGDLAIVNTATNGSTLEYTLSGTVPIGIHTVTVLAHDSNCALSTFKSFDVVVVAPNGTPATFQCKKIVKSLEDGPIPSVTFTSDEIVCVTEGSSCDPLAPTIISAFSADPTDNVRNYVCGDLGDHQVTMFIFDVLDSDNDGVLDTVFREPCFAIQTVVDQNGFCQF